jgi:hypothetical protein
MQRPELVPSSPFTHEYQVWAQAAQGDGDGGQSAIDQVLADHFMMDVVLSVITREAHALAERRPLRTELWDDVVDFVGNYIHQVHRRKEEQALFPALAAAGLVHLSDEVTTTIREHRPRRRSTYSASEAQPKRRCTATASARSSQRASSSSWARLLAASAPRAWSTTAASSTLDSNSYSSASRVSCMGE